ncbi:hypothetical protein A2V71_04060 [Candidatus Berkelbacteria bacterium RBG_13_40_8]|uniref:Uncharacterized protein n=1 Tax=Candidatus Berkelbacteria bacterium RBG_13_40_8 TaxID=1797467 RepID=A0A1F5DMC0_9BACT|nr:MAG: hypothetical protein A2V71_04060 [Candidatus Berkelbacteria bacterium RBG_13_40_8]
MKFEKAKSNLPPVDIEIESLNILKQMSPQDIKAIDNIDAISDLLLAANTRLAQIARMTVPKGRFSTPSKAVPDALLEESRKIRGLREAIVQRFRELEDQATKVA